MVLILRPSTLYVNKFFSDWWSGCWDVSRQSDLGSQKKRFNFPLQSSMWVRARKLGLRAMQSGIAEVGQKIANF